VSGDPGDAASNESRLVGRAVAGDADAYGDLVTMHQAAAFRVACLVLGSAADAEDAVQEGFVRAYGALGRFRPGEPFRPWLLTIVGNEARNRRRARGRRDGLLGRAVAVFQGSGESSGGPASAGSTGAQPELLILAGEANAELRAALEELDEGERLVVTCRYLLELSEAETAAALGIPAGTVKSRLHRGLRRLRTRLDDGAQDGEGSR
jgi:RNA polymerase sigma factor (sigma-70 family)